MAPNHNLHPASESNDLFVLGVLGPFLSPDFPSHLAAEYLVLRNALGGAPIHQSHWITLGDIVSNGPVRLSKSLQLDVDDQLHWASMTETWEVVRSFYKTIRAFTERLTEKSTFVLVLWGTSMSIDEPDAGPESESFIVGDLDPDSSNKYLFSEFLLRMALEQGPGERKSQNFLVTNLSLPSLSKGIEGFTLYRPNLGCICEPLQSAELVNFEQLPADSEALWSQIVSPITSSLGLLNHIPLNTLNPITSLTRPPPPPPSLAMRYRQRPRQWPHLHIDVTLKELSLAMDAYPPCHTNDKTHIIAKCRHVLHRNALERLSENDKVVLLDDLQRRQRLRHRAVALANRLGWISDEACQKAIESNLVEMDQPFNRHMCRETSKEMETAGFDQLRGWLETDHDDCGIYIWMEPTAWFINHWEKRGKIGIEREEWESTIRAVLMDEGFDG